MTGAVELQELAVAELARDTRLDRARAVAGDAMRLCKLAQDRAERVLGTATLLAQLLRCQGESVRELTEQRDRARRYAVAYENELAAVRELHKPTRPNHTCEHCDRSWPCYTAELVYLSPELAHEAVRVAS